MSKIVDMGDAFRQAKAERAFMESVLDEVARAQEKFPSSFGSMCALTEEVGEVAKAMMDEPSANVVAEAIQVAAMAMRVALEGDASLDPVREKTGVGPHPTPSEGHHG